MFKCFFKAKFFRFLTITKLSQLISAFMLHVKFFFQKLHFLLIPIRVYYNMITECILCSLIHRLVLLPYLHV